MIYTNTWSSITYYAQQKLEEFRLEFPGVSIGFIDWENANWDELPNTDLIGPASLMMTEYDKEVDATFAIGISTYTGDTNLFRHRKMVASVFEDLRPENKLAYYDTELVLQTSVLVVTAGTFVSPMTRQNVRPWQYVQAGALLVPA